MKKSPQPLVMGNWKMNPQTSAQAKRIFLDVKKAIARVDGVEVVIAPPTIYLSEIQKCLKGSKRIALGAQNVHWEKLGARTGETSLPMVAGVGVSSVIVGHSERRAMGETDEDVNTKVHAVLKAGMTAVVCVGEGARDAQGRYFTLVEKQIQSACQGVPKAKLARVVIAYEPIWAIGTGKTASPEDAHEMKLFIQKVLTDLYGRNVAVKVRILYGGSVNAKNAEELMRDGKVNGFLVGGASLRATEFSTIITMVKPYGA